MSQGTNIGRRIEKERVQKPPAGVGISACDTDGNNHRDTTQHRSRSNDCCKRDFELCKQPLNSNSAQQLESNLEEVDDVELNGTETSSQNRTDVEEQPLHLHGVRHLMTVCLLHTNLAICQAYRHRFLVVASGFSSHADHSMRCIYLQNMPSFPNLTVSRVYPKLQNRHYSYSQ